MLTSWKTLMSFALAACGVAKAAVIQHRVRGETPELNGLDKRANGKTQFAYFTTWGVYSTGRNFPPQSIDTTHLTHILYSFMDVDASSGALVEGDAYVDTQLHFATDSWNDVGNNAYGAVKQLYLLKQKKRSLKTLISIGGWTYAQAGHFNFVTNPSARATFIASCLKASWNILAKYIEDWGFDGIDIDFEYPTSAQKSAFVSLISELRTALTTYMRNKGETNPYLISIAVPAGQTNYVNFDVGGLNSNLDFWNLMAYDYAGSWSTVATHQANVYGGVTGFSTDAALSYYLGGGATPAKINFGIPIYGRGFSNTNGINQAFSGLPTGTWEAGIYDYKVLPVAGAAVTEDSTTIASYSYSSSARELVSYDTPNIVTKKIAYALSKGLGGAMFWELSADKTGSASLVTTAAAGLGTLDSTQNHLNYPGSVYDNIRSGMGSGNTTTTPPTSTTSSTTTGPTTTPGTGSCAGVAAWVSTTAYVGGSKVTYNSHLWTAKWWTQAEVPGGSSGVWTDSGAC
ncbi:glycoside hydrolase family 18 and carbohydrate-binding module family 5 protein [Auriculariales sp. MPI-PUGE-AT-0066]|nr:glycoside hydrolase family 18 and carbohydrate-binding module family 5 protein [Auriculariales sp. MPI-PUGE-AT-0066]